MQNATSSSLLVCPLRAGQELSLGAGGASVCPGAARARPEPRCPSRPLRSPQAHRAAMAPARRPPLARATRGSARARPAWPHLPRGAQAQRQFLYIRVAPARVRAVVGRMSRYGRYGRDGGEPGASQSCGGGGSAVGRRARGRWRELRRLCRSGGGRRGSFPRRPLRDAVAAGMEGEPEGARCGRGGL